LEQSRKFYITLRAARVNVGLSQKDVAELLGVHSDTISKYELDSSNIPRALSKQLVSIYQVPEERIFFGLESSFTGRFKRRNVS